MDTYWIKLVELRHCIKQQENFINLHNHNIDNGDTLNLLNDNVFKCGKEKGEASSWLIRFVDNLEILAV